MSDASPLPGDDSAWRPRWGYFGVFAVLAAIHLAAGWTSTSAIGLTLGLACTLVLVFVRRLPHWSIGNVSSPRLRGLRKIALLLVASLPAAAVTAGVVGHPPHGVDNLYAAFVLGVALGLPAFVLVRWFRAAGRFRRPSSRAAVGRHLRVRTVALVAVIVAGVAFEVTAFAASGGALPWVLAVPVLLAIASVANWRADIAHAARLLAAGPLTEIVAAGVMDGVGVSGWARFPEGIRARFRMDDCPAEIAHHLLARRRLWTAGLPHEGAVAVMVPEGDTFAVAVFTVKRREYRRRNADAGAEPRQ